MSKFKGMEKLYTFKYILASVNALPSKPNPFERITSQYKLKNTERIIPIIKHIIIKTENNSLSFFSSCFPHSFDP